MSPVTRLGFVRLTLAVVGTLALLAGNSAPAATQSDKARRPGWLQRATNGLSGRAAGPGQLTPAERTAISARLERVEDLFYAIPALARPQGFNVRPWFRAGSQDDGHVVQHDFSLAFYPGTATSGDADAGDISVTFNINLAGFRQDGSAGLTGEDGMVIYEEARRSGSFPGATFVHGGGVNASAGGGINILFTRDGLSPWRPVTREQYLKAQLFLLEGKGGEKIAEARKAALSPEQLAPLLNVVAKMRAEFDAMPAAARTLPAIIDYGDRSALVSFDSQDGDETARAVTPNPELWRPQTSRIEVRSVHVSLRSGPLPAVANAVSETFKQLDWAAIRAFVGASGR